LWYRVGTTRAKNAFHSHGDPPDCTVCEGGPEIKRIARQTLARLG